MDSLLHLLNIGMLSTWLSVVGFGSAGLFLPGGAPNCAKHPEVLDTQWLQQDFTLGDTTTDPGAEPADTPEIAPAEPMPSPPELPDLTEQPPLPELPELPPAPVTIPQPPTPAPVAIAPKSARTSNPRTSASHATARTSSRRGSTTAGNAAAGTGMSAAARLAAGTMPSPVYPAESRRLGQTGTLVVEFTVDRSGRVIAASAKSPSPWPLLNEEAVRTVRRWTFPPGPVMILQRPIVFQLR